MRIAIVDDDIQMCEQLSTLLNEFLGDSSEISDYRSGEEFLTAWETADSVSYTHLTLPTN